MIAVFVRRARWALLALAVALLLAAVPLFAGPPEYVFLTPSHWTSAEPLATWAIPRSSLAGDTLCVKPISDGLTDSLQSALLSLGIGSAELADLSTARARIASTNWQEAVQ
ncbi:hypothetical protein KQI52_14920 [bacterium]|nr:hypothetical protein [bacterium]